MSPLFTTVARCAFRGARSGAVLASDSIVAFGIFSSILRAENSAPPLTPSTAPGASEHGGEIPTGCRDVAERPPTAASDRRIFRQSREQSLAVCKDNARSALAVVRRPWHGTCDGHSRSAETWRCRHKHGEAFERCCARSTDTPRIGVVSRAVARGDAGVGLSAALAASVTHGDCPSGSPRHGADSCHGYVRVSDCEPHEGVPDGRGGGARSPRRNTRRV